MKLIVLVFFAIWLAPAVAGAASGCCRGTGLSNIDQYPRITTETLCRQLGDAEWVEGGHLESDSCIDMPGCCRNPRSGAGASGDDIALRSISNKPACENVGGTTWIKGGIFANNLCNDSIQVRTESPIGPASGPIYFEPQVSIPGSEFQAGAKILLVEGQGSESYATGIGKYIASAYTFVVGAIGFLAVIMGIVAGFSWLTAAGNPEKISAAQSMLLNAVVGVVLALLSYTILQIINPRLTEFRGFPVPYVVPKASDVEDFPTCRAFANDPVAERCDLSFLEDIGNGLYLQRNAATALRALLAEFSGQTGVNLQVNSTFRNSQRQACLRQTLLGANGQPIANPPCQSNHEKALAVDLSVSALTIEQFKTLLDLAESHDFKNNNWSSSDSIPTDWNTKDERWHFDYTGTANVSSLTVLCPGKADPPSNCR